MATDYGCMELLLLANEMALNLNIMKTASGRRILLPNNGNFFGRINALELNVEEYQSTYTLT